MKKHSFSVSEQTVSKYVRLKRRELRLIEKAIWKGGYKNFSRFAAAAILEKTHKILTTQVNEEK